MVGSDKKNFELEIPRLAENYQIQGILETTVLQPDFFNLDGNFERGKTPCTVTPAGGTMVGAESQISTD